MRLYLVQHGEATSKELDPERPLTEKGRSDVIRVAGFLKAKGIELDFIWHSTKTRARQTAGILAEAVPPKSGLTERQDLSPNDPVDKLQKEIHMEEKDIMIVGHLPFLQKLASLLLVDDETHQLVGFRQGGVVCLKREQSGIWILAWSVTPELIK